LQEWRCFIEDICRPSNSLKLQDRFSFSALLVSQSGVPKEIHEGTARLVDPDKMIRRK